jgi:hypothetical protein
MEVAKKENKYAKTTNNVAEKVMRGVHNQEN